MTGTAIWTVRGIIAASLLVLAFMQGAMWQQRKDIALVQRATATLQEHTAMIQEGRVAARRPKLSKVDAQRMTAECSKRLGYAVNPSHVEYFGTCPTNYLPVDQAALDKKWEMSLDEMMGTRSGKGVVEHDLPGQVSVTPRDNGRRPKG